jgi:hypothetical protein
MMLSRPALAATLLATAALLIPAVRTLPVNAQVPNRVYGTVTLDGAVAPVGTPIVALASGKTCASATVTALQVNGTNYPYRLDVPDGSAAEECIPGAVLTFTVGGKTAGQTFTLSDIGSFQRLDLSAPGVPNVPVSTAKTVTLAAGCTQITSAFPDGTGIDTIVAAITPASAVGAIWRFDPAKGAYQGFSPAVGWANDLGSVKRGDVLRICATATATLAQPV